MKNTKTKLALALMLFALCTTAYAKTSHIVWDPGELNPPSVAPGESATYTVSLRNAGPDTFETKHVKVAVSGDVASVLSVRKTEFPKKMKRGESIRLTFDATIPSETPMEVLQGSVVLMRSDDDRDGKGDDHREKEGKKVFWSETLPVELTVSSIPLPPDPGDAGKQDVAGIDTDENGVRDDIDRYIGFTYPGSEKIRMALTQYAREQQKVLLDAQDRAKTIEHARAQIVAYRCLKAIYGADNDSAINARKLLDIESMNTSDRSRAKTRAEYQFAGQGIDASSNDEEDKASCAINPDTLPN